MPLAIQRYYWSIPGLDPSPLQASGGYDCTPWIPHWLILYIIPRKESVMSFQCCPQCLKRTLAPTGAFWCCTNCETAITSQALAAMRALSNAGTSQKGLLVTQYSHWPVHEGLPFSTYIQNLSLHIRRELLCPSQTDKRIKPIRALPLSKSHAEE
jgi:hypothetical protein